MNLSGKLLIAMPGMGDPRFDHSVVFICAHSDDGAMGLIVNKPARDLSFDQLQEQLGITRTDRSKAIRVHFGGPVEHARGFVLHSADYGGEGTTLQVDDQFGMTATLDILEAIAQGRGPSESILALGYAGWGPGQLEGEILSNGWLTCDANPDLVFSDQDDGKWTRALKTLGVDPLTLSSAAGHA
ncbi:YqgE/AlgH family protein [Defluviimonas sp. D31]|uniref:YqgE/AlgH family protein n=1 Tax=Defluviimonas sp. D31 TaxID=3083253 RepID=UPI00296E5E70|nr:YqgE/AlgH family protein [Defluviimonas sp. D31]MDW4550552.1 YqgE/AlgH family protein [Defluviimonas sp. D31]